MARTHRDDWIEAGFELLRTAGQELAMRSVFTVTPTRWRESRIMT